ncbi:MULTISPECIES: TadG family pilus assembly protein [unclassified Bradyrhizobium]|uniref:TadG family pilus assembly protein n=1 Tax=unclassified Bradyrhizobium TaxID=2631580 RepID=UPI0003602095|nr:MULTISPECIES: TadG family pilus assembly protein [unclassified Bradyrhizobium]MBB4398056.1 Flp pilus assembly protein TadG [Bradyrhizobium sp. ERR14]
MRSLLRSQRGSVAFATVIALVPLIGVVALGAEAGSWYVTRQHAQNAADSAAYSGALRLSCTMAGAACETQTVDYRGKEFAAQNGFCNSSPNDSTPYPGTTCAPSLPSRISRAVQIDIGNYNAGTFTTPVAGTGNAVRARVSQQQPAYLAAVLGLTTVDIPAQAIAVVQQPTKACVLALGPDLGALKLAGNLSNNGTGCALMSDTSVQLASTPTFTGSGWAVYGVNGCTPSSSCSNVGVPYNYFMTYANNPLSKLNTASFNSRTGNASMPCTLQADGWKHCAPNSAGTGAYGSFTVQNGDKYVLDPGTYFFYKANIKVTGGQLKGAGVTLVLLGDSQLTINGGTVDLSAPATNTFSSDLNGVLIDDQAPSKTSNKVTINGGGLVSLGGAIYFPNVDVSWAGTTASTNTTCSQVIAKTLDMSGGGYLSTQGCDPATIVYTQVVALVQ